MPYLTKKFNHVISDSTATTWNYEKRNGETITYNSYFTERKGYADQFFIDLKELLQQTNLTITFDDENNTFNIFDIDFMLKCLNSNDTSYWTNPNYYQYSGVRPVIILPRISNAISNTSGNSNYSLERFGYTYMTYSSSNSAYLNNSCHWIHCNSSPNDDIKRQVSYTIKIYYNTNYIMCSYISFSGYEVPLFCFIQGEIITTKQKAVYLSTCINNNDSNQFHHIVIPSQNTDKNKYYDYLPFLGNISKLGAIFDQISYPNDNILTKLSSDGNVNTDIFLNKLTAYGGLITFDNVFDVSRKNASNLTSQILTKTLYTINGSNYYCPGFSIPYYNTDSSDYGRYIFKI